MILYSAVIFIAVLLLSTGNILFSAPRFGFGAGFAILCVLLSVVAAIAVDGVFAALIRRMPEKWFAHDKKFFQVSAKEKKFYEKLKIRKWKEKIPELGQFTNFHKNKVADPHNNIYLRRYMLEACYGEAIHLVCVAVGFLIVFFFPLKYWLCFGFPVAVINALLHLPPFFILRYNFYKMKLLYQRNERRELRAGKILCETSAEAEKKNVKEPPKEYSAVPEEDADEENIHVCSA